MERKLLIPFIIILFVAPVLIRFSGVDTTSQTIYPSRDISVYTYSDMDIGGNSKILSFVEDSTIKMDFVLNAGYSFPYCGIGFDLKELTPKLRDFKKYGQIDIKLRTLHDMDLRINLKPYIDGFTDPDNPMSYQFYEKAFRSSQNIEIISLSLDKFIVPVWWFETNQGFTATGKRHLEDVHYIQVINSSFSGEDKTDSIEIVYMELKGFSYFWYIVYFVFVFAFVIFAISFKIAAKLKKKLKSNAITSANEDKIFSYISSNYSNPDLTLEIIANDTGIAKNTISKLINKSLNRSFKVYLNEIRVREAARLLMEKDMAVSEVCYSVGYNNLIHFNRVFKSIYTVSPKEYKKQNSK